MLSSLWYNRSMRKRDTKKEILDKAQELFYRYGYNDTSLEMIARDLGIDKQLIAYHFGTKEKLGVAVQNRINTGIRKDFLNTASSMSVRSIFYANAAFALWLPRFLCEDENARRFYEDMLLAAEFDIDALKEQYFDNYKDNAANPERQNLAMPNFPDYVVSYLSARWLMHFYCRGDLEMDPDDFERKYFYLNCDPFFSNHKRLEAIFTGAKALLEDLDIVIKPVFKVSIKPTQNH